MAAFAVVPIGAGVAYVSLPAHAQTAQPQTPPPPGDKARPGPGSGPMGPMRMGPDHMGPMGPMADRFRPMHHGWGESPQMRLAEKLAAVETAIGVRSDQMDAWRDFTSKLMAFATPELRMHQWHRHAGSPSEPPLKAGNAQGDATPPSVPPAKDVGKDFGPLAHIVDRAIQRGEQAKQLKAAMDKLDGVLTPQQIQMARSLMRPEHGMRHGWHNWHRDHMWHGHEGWQGHQGWGPRGGGSSGPTAPGPDSDQQ